jgi:hypothetical protein
MMVTCNYIFEIYFIPGFLCSAEKSQFKYLGFLVSIDLR